MKLFTTQQFKKIIVCVFTSYALFSTGNVNAGLLAISDKPLDVIEGVPANIILTMDDSGSMAWGYMPDLINDLGLRNTNRGKAANVNTVYYDPKITYTPAVDKYGLSLGNSTFKAAWKNGFTKTGNVDLSKDFQVDWRWNFANGTGAAYYYYFDTTKLFSGATACDITNYNHTHTGGDNCYTKVVVGTSEEQNFANWYSYYRLRHLSSKTAATKSFSTLSDTIRIAWMRLGNTNMLGNPMPLTGTHRTNFFKFLNTVQYDGSTPLRNAFNAAGQKFTKLAPYRKDPTDSSSPAYSCRQNFHFAFTDGQWNGSFSSIGNKDNSSFNMNSPKYGTKKYTPTSSQAVDATPPIYRGMDQSGYLADIALYYWATDLQANLQNDVPVYEVDISTDIDRDGDVDSNDIFWNPKNDPAQWQHMVSFFIGLGVGPTSKLTFDGTTTSGSTYDELMLGPSGNPADLTPSRPGVTWGNNKIDDMWHAALNGRGQYFSSSNPEELVTAFKAILDNIDDRTASNSAIATTSSELLTGAVLYQASYDPGNWSGEIRAMDATLVPGTATSRTGVNLTTKWSGKAILAAQGTNRQIITFDPVKQEGIPFTWTDINTNQKLALNTLGGKVDTTLGQDRLKFIRGDISKEARNGGTFRNRNTSLYGDIVHSDPTYVAEPGPPTTFYPDSLESNMYSTFVTNKKGRTPMLVFGGNDGMLHILNADTGVEILGYVPSPVYRNLSELTNPAYNHKFFVDETVRIEDVYFTNSWHTVVIGGLGKGGQGIYALDITEPNTLSETTAKQSIMWEFTDNDDADLGYTFTRPQLFKMNNGKWMAAFSNGYNSNEDDTATGGKKSTTGNGIMYFIDLETGGKGSATGPGTLVKLDTLVGLGQDPTLAGRANRLTDFVAIDTDKNFTADYLYAGDLFGNLWKFDVTDSNPANWKVIGDTAGPKPLFTAKDSLGNNQPITLKPQILKQRTQDGILVYFGTSKYLETGDRTDTSIQSIYAIWDREEVDSTNSPVTSVNNYTIDRSHLKAQWIDFEGVVKDTDGTTDIPYRTSTSNATNKLFGRYVINWFSGTGLPSSGSGYLGWYIDLGVTGGLTDPVIAAPDGEKIDNHLFVDASGDGVIEFATLVPNTDPCDKGGNSWLYRLDPYTGNLFGGFQFIDKSTVQATNSAGKVVNVSAAKFAKRSSITKTYDTSGDCTEVNIVNSSDGNIGVATSSCSNKGEGRRSWRQILIE